MTSKPALSIYVVSGRLTYRVTKVGPKGKGKAAHRVVACVNGGNYAGPKWREVGDAPGLSLLRRALVDAFEAADAITSTSPALT